MRKAIGEQLRNRRSIGQLGKLRHFNPYNTLYSKLNVKITTWYNKWKTKYEKDM